MEGDQVDLTEKSMEIVVAILCMVHHIAMAVLIEDSMDMVVLMIDLVEWLTTMQIMDLGLVMVMPIIVVGLTV
jgi:hypothetical protein